MRSVFVFLAAFGLSQATVFQAPMRRIDGAKTIMQREGSSFLSVLHSLGNRRLLVICSGVWNEYLAQLKAEYLERAANNATYIHHVTDINDFQYVADISIGEF